MRLCDQGVWVEEEEDGAGEGEGSRCDANGFRDVRTGAGAFEEEEEERPIEVESSIRKRVS